MSTQSIQIFADLGTKIASCLKNGSISFKLSIDTKLTWTVVLVEEADSVRAREREAVLSRISFLVEHFLLPTCCRRYLLSPKVLLHSGQVKTRLPEEVSRKGLLQLSLCLVKP